MLEFLNSYILYLYIFVVISITNFIMQRIHKSKEALIEVVSNFLQMLLLVIFIFYNMDYLTGDSKNDFYLILVFLIILFGAFLKSLYSYYKQLKQKDLSNDF